MFLGYYTAMPLLTVISTLYPAYSTYKAAVNKGPEAMEHCLQYWVIFAMISCVEYFVDLVGAFLPFYYEIKIGGFFWLVFKDFKGSALLFTKYIAPFVKDYEAPFDEKLEFMWMKTKNLKSDDLIKAANWVQGKMNEVMGKPTKAAATPPARATPAAKKEKAAEQVDIGDAPQEPEEVVEVVEKEEVKKDQ
jgi:hypothetical protein